MVLKYLVYHYPMQTLYFGIANVVANGLVMLRFVLLPVLLLFYSVRVGLANWVDVCSTVVLWVSQNLEDDYTYNLAL